MGFTVVFCSVRHRLQGQLLPGLRAGLGVGGLSQFPYSTLGFQRSHTPGPQRVLPARSCFFPVGALPLDSELALFRKRFGSPLRWAASTLGRPCRPGLGGQGFLSIFRHASVIYLSRAREDLLLILQQEQIPA